MKRHNLYKLFIISLLVVFFSENATAQQATVTVQQDSKIPKLLSLKKNLEKNNKLSDVYTIQLYYGELSKANSIIQSYRGTYGTWPASIEYDREWLYEWIKNSQGLIATGDAQAVAIYEEYNKSVMTSFPGLSNTDIDNILAYTSQPKPEPVAALVPPGGAVEGGSGVSNNIILGALALVFLLLVVMLVLVSNTLKRIAQANGVVYAEKEKRTPIWKAFVENQFLVLVSSVFLLLAAGYFMYGFFMQVGVDQGYAPVQPIHYSHRIHAGANEIDCNYCHSSARKSKHSGIPSLNVCMNCHKNIAVVADEVQAEGMDEFGVDYNKEIEKLYDAVGWDVDEQAYTGESKPVKWVRIHNLPDFAYFNHSQHVTVAGIACQQCHGPVEEMEIMYQYSSLTMGWCINCHRGQLRKVSI